MPDPVNGLANELLLRLKTEQPQPSVAMGPMDMIKRMLGMRNTRNITLPPAEGQRPDPRIAQLDPAQALRRVLGQ